MKGVRLVLCIHRTLTLKSLTWKMTKRKKFKLLVLVSSLEYPPVAYTLSANCLFVHFLVYLCVCILSWNHQNPKTQYLSKYSSRGKMLNRTLGVLHNLSKRVPTRMNFAACQALDILIPLLKAEVALFGAKGLLVLACLIDEDNNHLIMADEGIYIWVGLRVDSFFALKCRLFFLIPFPVPLTGYQMTLQFTHPGTFAPPYTIWPRLSGLVGTGLNRPDKRESG